MGIFPEEFVDAIFLSRSDVYEPLGTFSEHGFDLEGKHWPSVEHYYQAMKFTDEAYQETIRQAAHPKLARKLGRKKKVKIRSDWKKVREVVMTRGVYIKCRTHPEIAQTLLDTDERNLVENSQYDYFWGCGRDRRGVNAYGRVLKNVRAKLRQEQSENAQKETAASDKEQAAD